jgi:hypothetical protein
VDKPPTDKKSWLRFFGRFRTGDWVNGCVQCHQAKAKRTFNCASGRDGPAKILEIVQRSRAACAAAGIRLWINDYWQAAVEAGCWCARGTGMVKCIDGEGGLEAMQAANMALGINTFVRRVVML